jgi:hypothetical protein
LPTSRIICTTTDDALSRPNALLIAAAPDLLYQLKQVESQLSRGEPFPPAAIVAIRAAISKAEGGAK